MKFSDFLKALRTDCQLSQLQMLNKLALNNDQFADLTVVTYSRWERGVSTPPLIKMLNIAKVFNVDIFEFLTTIQFKESKSQIKSFDVFSAHFANVSNHFRLLQPRLFNEEFCYYGKDEQTPPQDFLASVKKYWNVFLKQQNTDDNLINTSYVDNALNNGSLYITSCNEPDDQEVLAQGIYVLQNTHREQSILDDFSNQTLSIKKLSCVDNDSDKFIFVPLIALHSAPWLNFNLYNFVKTFTKIKGITKIYIVASQVKTFSKLKYLGFNIEQTIKSEIKNKIGSSYAKSEISLHLMSCDFDEFICNHGLVNLIKHYKDY